MISRTSKQLVIGGVYILIAAIIAGGIYFTNYRATCTDGVKNGQEEGLDCGALACGVACASPVQALVVQNVQLVKTEAGDYDFAALVYNPNTEYGADAVEYGITAGPAGSQPIARGTFYILPGQTKYIVRTSLKVDTTESAALDITSVEWQKVALDSSRYFSISRDVFTPSPTGTTYEAVITNNSDYDFASVDVAVVVTNDFDQVLATNMTNMQTLLSRTDRSVKVSWPFELPANAHIDVEVGTNVFNNANFLKANGTKEKFQQYY